MPNLAEIVGRPLPDNGMPAGTVSVRVARKMPSNGVAGAEVSAVIKNAGGDLRRRTEKTDADGRALFEGMAPGDEFNAEVTVDGELLKTEAFTIPQVGGLRTMLIAALGKGGGNAAPGEGAAASGAGAGGPSGQFTLGATAGVAVTDPSLPAGRLEVSLFDESGAPIPNQPVLLGMVDKTNKIDVRHGKSDATGVAHFADLPRGDGTGYAAVLEWHGMRLGTAPFPMPESGGARAEIRALGRTVRSVGDDHRLRRPRHRPDARGQPAVPGDVPAREPLRQDVRSGAGRHRDPAAEGVRQRRGAGERPQDRRASEPRDGGPRRLHPPARHPGHHRQERRPGSGVRFRAPLPRRHARVLPADAERDRDLHPDHRADSGAHRHRSRDRRAPGARARRPQVLGHAGRADRARAASWSSR